MASILSPLISSRSQNNSLFAPSTLIGTTGPTGAQGIPGPTGPANSIDNFVTGMIIVWNNAVAPVGWTLCDGSNGSPNLQGRFVVGTSGTLPFTFGNTGGASTVTLIEANLPAHTHTVNTHQGAGSAAGAGDSAILVGTQTSSSTGSGTAFSILPPFHTLSYIMKL
jgi:microcystin-dependent protein